MATANVGLQFTADKGLPTLQQVLKALQDIKKATAEKIDIKISTNVEKTGQSLTTVANGLKKVKEANLQEKDIQKIERLNNIFKAENNSKMNQFGQSLGEVAKGLSKLANADSEKLARNLDVIKSNLNAISKINLSNLNSLGNITNLTSNVRNLTGTNGASSQAKEPTGNKSMLSITEYMARYAGAYAAFNIGKASLVELYDFEKAITQIGIAGEMSQTQIQSLRYEYGNLATENGISAKEIAMAGEVIIKTGQSLSDTNLILKEAIKLSKATGDSLSYTAESLSKILLTLQISAEHVTDVTNMMMSVANKTPASMQSLQEGLKQSNAGFANFAESTTKSGEALEEYKLKLIQTELAMMGGLAQLGRKGKHLLLIA